MAPVPKKLATKDDLTELEAEMVRYMGSGVKPTEAARLAGYASPDKMASVILRRPRVQVALRQQRQGLYKSDMAHVAIETLREIMGDKKAPAAARVRAAQVTLTLAGDIGPAGDAVEKEGSGKALEDFTREELELFIARNRAVVQAADSVQIEGSARVVPDPPSSIDDLIS